jgi:hypothetical protein
MDKPTTICTVCKQETKEESLAVSPRTNKRVKVCEPCWIKHYANLSKPRVHHQAKQRAKDKLSRDKQVNRNRQYIAGVLKNTKCMDCGYSNWIALEFDHREPESKIDAVTKMAGDGISLARLTEEIEKCDVVCANCHAIRTAKQFNSWRVGFMEG